MFKEQKPYKNEGAAEELPNEFDRFGHRTTAAKPRHHGRVAFSAENAFERAHTRAQHRAPSSSEPEARRAVARGPSNRQERTAPAVPAPSAALRQRAARSVADPGGRHPLARTAITPSPTAGAHSDRRRAPTSPAATASMVPPPGRGSSRCSLLAAAASLLFLHLRTTVASQMPGSPDLASADADAFEDVGGVEQPPPVTFHSITFTSGSPLGAQRLAIEGEGFTTNFHDGNNKILIGSDVKGWTSCSVVEGACTVDCGSASRIVCDTDKIPESWLTADTVAGAGSKIELADLDTGPLSVKVTVCRSGSLCDTADAEDTNRVIAVADVPFAFTPARDSHLNPTLLGVHPRQITADDPLSLTGSRFGNDIKGYRVVYVGAGRPPIGGNVDTGTTTIHAVCRPQELNRAHLDEVLEEKFITVQAEDFEPLPITPDFYKCNLGDFEAGNYNVSVQLPMGMAWANPVDAGLFSTDAAGTKYEVQYFPTITEVWPPAGSLAGGTEVIIRGRGFSMDEEDIAIDLGGSRCVIVSSTLEEIICVTEPAEETAAFSCTAGSGTTECATCADPLTREGECTSCNGGAVLLDGACRQLPTATITVEATAARVHGMASEGSDSGTFVSDQGLGKGHGWAIFSASVAVSGTYEVHLLVPGDAYCTPRSTSVPVVVHHSGTARRTVVTADLSAAGPAMLGSFYFDAPTSARVIVDNRGTQGCVGIAALQLVPSSAARPSEGCMNSTALNFEAAASSDDGSCIYVGGRGLLRQQWGLMPPEKEVEIAASSPAAVLQESVDVSQACPGPGEEAGWDLISGDSEACTSVHRQAIEGANDGNVGDACNADSRCTYDSVADACLPIYTDCSTGRCPSHDACPADAFCCLDGAHARCTPPAGNVSAFDTDDDGWKLVFRQTLPSTDRENGGYSLPGELSRNPDDDTASMYSVLDQLEGLQADDWMYELKLTYPGTGDIHWKQSVNPTSGDSLLTGSFQYVDDDTPVWHPTFRQQGCQDILDVGESFFNAMFERASFSIVRYDRKDAASGEMVPYAFYRRFTPIPRGISLYDILTNSFSSNGHGNEQDVDWRAYSSMEEAKDGTNPWKTCLHDGSPGVGFPGDCGVSGSSKMRWISKTLCSQRASPDTALFIYAPANAFAQRPSKFRGLSSALAPAHGHLLDAEQLDVIAPGDDDTYIPWYGLGVTQTAPAGRWGMTPEEIAETNKFTFDWWHHNGNLDKLRAKDTYPHSPDGTINLRDYAETPSNRGSNFGGRMYGWFLAPEDGAYKFFVASDDTSQLFLGEDELSTEMIASVNSWRGARQWNCRSCKSALQTLQAGKYYWMEAVYQEGGGGDNLAVGMLTPTDISNGDTSPTEPIKVSDRIFSMRQVTPPRAMEMTPCALEDQECSFSNLALVRFSLGWDSVPPMYSVAVDGVTCRPFGTVGGEEYVHVATDRICVDTAQSQKVEEIAPNELPDEYTEKEIVAACQTKCDERSDCAYFVSWANHACFSYASCYSTTDGAAVPTTELVYVNTRRSKGRCDMIPVTSQWTDCAAEGSECAVADTAVVRFGAGNSFNYVLVEADAPVECSQRTFGLGSPGKRKCDAAFVGIPARIAGPEKFVEQVELYVRPRTTSASPTCQSCKSCVDADGRAIPRNLAFHAASATWSTPVQEACNPTSEGVDAQTCADVILDGTEATCTGAGACTYTAAASLATTTSIVGDPANTVDAVTSDSGIIGGNLNTVCSTASGVGTMTWSVDLESVQTVTSVRVWPTLVVEGNTDVAVSVDGTLCGTIPVLHPGTSADVQCGVSGQVVTVSSSTFLGLCEVEVFGSALACPDFCVAGLGAYPAPIAATHQLVTLTDGLVQDASCDPEVTACDGEAETLIAEIPGKSHLRLGGVKYQGLFVAPVTGEYTFRSRFDDVGEVWLSEDSDPRHADLIIDSTDAVSDGWFGPQHDPHEAHIELELKTQFEGPLFITLLGSAARTDEMLLARGSAGWGRGAGRSSSAGCAAGEMLAEYFTTRRMNGEPSASRCEPAAERDGYIIDNWDSDLTLAAAEMGVTETNFAIRFTTTVLFPQDGVYRIKTRANDYSTVTISGHPIFFGYHHWKHANQNSNVDIAFGAGAHTVVFDFGARSGYSKAELKWELVTAGRVSDAIDSPNPVVQQHIRDIVPLNQHGFPTILGSVRAIRLRNPDDRTCLGNIIVTVRGRRYAFRPKQCFQGEAELDLLSAEPVSDLATQESASAQISGDVRVARAGLVSWYKWSGWDKANQVWSDATGNGNEATSSNDLPVMTKIETDMHGATGQIGYLSGDTSRDLLFGDIIHTQFTICSVTRYAGSTQERVIDGKLLNWLHGHHDGKAGVAYYETWKSPQTNQLANDNPPQNSTNWVVLCGSNEAAPATLQMQLLAGLEDISASVGGTGATSIGINLPGNTEHSDWGVAEVITWDRHLTTAEMEDSAEYLVGMLSSGNVAPEDLSASEVDRRASVPVQMQAGDVRFLEILHANSGGADESLVTLAIEKSVTFPRSCVQILADRPESGTGVYTVDPAGTGQAFDVVCDMTTEGGGWFKLTLADPGRPSTSSWKGVLMAESETTPWAKCDDDGAQFYDGAEETTPFVTFGMGTVGIRPIAGSGDTTVKLRYARPDTGQVYTAEQMDALRTQVDQLSTASRIVATTADDDGAVDEDLANGHEVFAYDAGGVEMLLTPGEDGDCGPAEEGLENSRTGFRLWTTAAHQSSISGDVTGLPGPLPDLPGSFALPTHVRLVVESGGGGCSFGYERRQILVKPGNEWVPAVTAATCSHPDVTTSTCTLYGSTCYLADLESADPQAACEAQDHNCTDVADDAGTDVNEARCNPPVCSEAVLGDDDEVNEAACAAVSLDCRYLTTEAACTTQNEWTDTVDSGSCSDAALTPLGGDACRATNSWDAHTSTCSNSFEGAATCVAPNIWIPPVWRSYCDTDANGERAATLTCSSTANSRITSCANGYYKITGEDDDPGTGDVNEESADACAPNACTAVGETDLAVAGYIAEVPDATTIPGLGALACASGFRLSAAASAASATCAAGGSFAFRGCIVGAPDPELEDDQIPAPAPTRACPDVENAAYDATYACDGEFSRISACAGGFFKAIGGGTSPDTCTACTPVGNARATSTSCVLAVIGSSGSVSKTGSIIPGDYVCPEVVDRDVWAGDETYGDTFTVSQVASSGTVTVTRTDTAAGWGLNLRFACCDPVLSCTAADNTRVSECATGYTLVTGADNELDQCIPSTCAETTVESLEAAGYMASGVTGATLVADLGSTECASGYRLTDPAIAAAASCPVADAQFSFTGCEPITCEASSPDFLTGFDLSSVSLPIMPTDTPAADLEACLSTHAIKQGSTPITVSCGADGEYTLVSGDIVCGECTPIANAAAGARVVCPNDDGNAISKIEGSPQCDDSAVYEAGFFSTDPDVCTAKVCIAMDSAALAAAGYVAENAGGTIKAAYGALTCAVGYQETSTPNIRCPNGDGTFQLSGCGAIQCSGTPSFLDGFDLTGIILPAVANDPDVTGISACLPSIPIIGGSTPLTVACNLHGEYELVSGTATCAACTPVANAATHDDFQCVDPHSWIPTAEGTCDSSQLTSEEECVVQNVWTPPSEAFCSNPTMTTEASCLQLSHWFPITEAFCTDSSLSTEAECETVDAPATTTQTIVTSDVLALSAEFLRVPMSSPNTIDLAVNGIAAACSAGADCSFVHSDDLTPTIRSVTPTSGGVGTELTIVGLNYPEEINTATATVTIGPAGGCDVTEIAWTETETTIKCTVSATAMGGTFPISIHAEPWGHALGSSTTTFAMNLVIADITPSAGSLKGGTVVTISGEGFANFGPYNKIEIGGVPCIPKTYKNMECRKDAVSMGFTCNHQLGYAYDPLHVRQFGEWFDFSSSTEIKCRLSKGTSVDTVADVVVTLIDPAVMGTDHLKLAIEAAWRGSVLERLTGGCEELANCKTLDPATWNRYDTPHSCQAVESCTLAKMYPINPDQAIVCAMVDISGHDSAADKAACEAAGSGGIANGVGPCLYSDGSADEADCAATMLTTEWNNEPWGALDSRGICTDVPGCSYISLSSRKFGDEFSFSGESVTEADAYTFAQSATPTITRITPDNGMPGSRVEIFGTNLAAALPVTDTNYYMSRFGFFEQPLKVDVWLGEDAPCAVVHHEDTYIRCVTTTNTMSEIFPLIVDVHGAGWAATNLQYKYDLYVNSISLRAGSPYGGTKLRIEGGGFAQVHNTYGEATDGSAIGQFMGSSLVTPHVTLCDRQCVLFEGMLTNGRPCVVTSLDGSAIECETAVSTKGVSSEVDVRVVVEWNGAPYMAACRIGEVVEACNPTAPGVDDGACYGADIWSGNDEDSRTKCEAAGACAYTAPVEGDCPYTFSKAHMPVADVFFQDKAYGEAAVGDIITFKFLPSSPVAIMSASLEDFTVLRNPTMWLGDVVHAAGASTYEQVGIPLCSSMELRIDGGELSLLCTLAPHPYGHYQPVVKVAPYGWSRFTGGSYHAATIHIKPMVATVAGNTGGAAGGTEITLAGPGLVDWSSHVQIVIGADPDIPGTGTPCEITSTAPSPWQLVFRQTAGFGWFGVDEWSRNSDDPANAMFSLLDTVESFRNTDGKFTFKLVWPRMVGRSTQQLVWRQVLNPTRAEPYCSNPILRTKKECIAANRWMPDVNCYNVDCGTVATLCTNPAFTTKEECETTNTWQQADRFSGFELDVMFEAVDNFGSFSGLRKGEGPWALIEGVGHSGVDGDHLFSVGAMRPGETAGVSFPGPYEPTTQVELHVLPGDLPPVGGTATDSLSCRTQALDAGSALGADALDLQYCTGTDCTRSSCREEEAVCYNGLSDGELEEQETVCLSVGCNWVPDNADTTADESECVVSGCSFEYVAAPAATDLGVGSETLSRAAALGQTLVIQGTGFATSGNVVTVGPLSCTIASETTTQIECAIPDAGVGGYHPITVVVPGSGMVDFSAAPGCGWIHIRTEVSSGVATCTGTNSQGTTQDADATCTGTNSQGTTDTGDDTVCATGQA